MSGVQRYRGFGVVIAVLLTVSLAGCGVLSGGGCGPGDTEIGAAADTNGTITVTGEVVKTGPGSFAIDDGTGTAMIPGQQTVEKGDCVTVEGVSTVDTSEMNGADVVIAANSTTVN